VRTPRFMLLILALALIAAACGEGPTTAVDPTPTPDATATPTEEVVEEATDPPGDDVLGEGVTVVTTVFALAALAEEIAPGADVTLLTSSGQDPHDLELTPGDRALIESADVVLYMGDIDFQPQVESAVADATGTVVAVAEVAGPDALRDFDGHSHDDEAATDEDDGHSHDDEAATDEDDGHSHDDEAATDEDDGHGHDDEDDGHDDGDAHDDDGVDPHLWFDATVMAEVAEEIGEAIAAMDEDNADALRERAEAVHDELLALDEEIDEILSGCARDTAIVSHEAYAYLLEPRGLEQEGISGAGGHGDASPQRLAELTERIRAEGIPAVLAEPLEGRADAETLANEAGVELLEIDPLELGSDELFALGFVAALRQQAQTFAEALECG
jgi:zinc transport system substrate-binding protein